jgi:tripartite-type tricarboxylate transporter receptor subunit TctC
LLRAAAALALACTATLAAAEWPDRPVRIVVPYPAGGLTDVVTRVMSDALGRELGQPVIVENKAGAGGQIGLQGVLAAPRDGYTVALVVPATMVTLPLTSAAYKIRPLQDFEPVTAAVETYMTLVVAPSLGIKTLPEFVAYAKRNDGKLNYGTPGAGTSYHFSNLVMARKLGIQPVHIPYQGESQFLNDLASGVLQYALVSSAGRAFIEGGKIVPLAMTHSTRSPTLPNVPTFVEQGVDFTTDGWVGYAVAAGTPAPVVDRLNAAMIKALRSTDVSRRLTDMGFIVVGNDRNRFKANIVASTKVYEELVKSGDVKVSP